MTTPRVKRAFAGASSDPAQRQITSFFGRDLTHDADPSSSRPGYERRSSSPLLPPSVQANLLAVGMRVRKSVPEGYKTGKEEGETAPRPRAAMAATATYALPSYSSYSAANPTPSLARSAGAVQRELTPFCGLHKVGGLSVQSFGDGDNDGRPLFAASLFDGDDDDGDSEPPSLTSSQETVSSTMSSSSYFSPASTRKRFFGQEEEEEEEDEQDNTNAYENGPVDDAGAVYQPRNNGRAFQVHEDVRQSVASASSFSSFRSPVNGWLTSGNAGRRVLAVPRRRQKQGEPQQQQQQQQPPRQTAVKQADGSLLFRGQENVEAVGDFDEADFLDASMLAAGGDMEMGGM
ncbi:MAG: hypothetical protein STHCBS139747_002999 [Sporothrix thermara]